MNDMEKMEFADRIKAMDEEEKKLAVRLFPSETLIDEIKRRCEKSERVIADVRDLLRVRE